MGHQIIKEPGRDTYAVFSSFTDTWIMWNSSREDLIRYYAEKAAEDARERATRILDQVDIDPREAYFQFAMSFDEANARSIEYGGADLTNPEDRDGRG